MDINTIAALSTVLSGILLLTVTPIVYFFFVKKMIEKKYCTDISIRYPFFYALDWGLPQVELSFFIVLNKFGDLLGVRYKRRFSYRCLWQILRDEINYNYRDLSLAEKIFAYVVCFLWINMLASMLFFILTK